MNAPMRHAKLRVNPPLGRRPVLQNCRIGELQIDSAYQRSIDNENSRRLIRHIAQHWDWNLCQPLVVAMREGGELFVVDGQHRLAAARMRQDLYDLPCVITSHAGLAEEAATFVSLNQARRPLSALDIFKAAIASGDPDSLEVLRLMENCGLAVAPHGNPVAWKPGMVAHVSSVVRYYRAYGGGVLETSMRLLAGAFAGEVLRYGATIHRGIVEVVAGLKDELDFDLLLLVLQGEDQDGWIREFARLTAERGIERRRACAIAIDEAYAEALADDP